MPWFTANITALLYEYAKKHMSKHSRVCSAYQLVIGAGNFKQAFVTHETTRSPTDNTMMLGVTEKPTMSSSNSERVKNTFGNFFPFI